MRGHPDSNIDPGCPPWPDAPNSQTPQADVMSAEDFYWKTQDDWTPTQSISEIEQRDAAIRQSERAKADELVKCARKSQAEIYWLCVQADKDSRRPMELHKETSVRMAYENMAKALAHFTSSNAPKETP